MAHLAIRFDYGHVISSDREAARQIGEIFARPELALLRRVNARRLDARTRPVDATAATIATYLDDASNDCVNFDNGANGDLLATARVDSGPHVHSKSPPATRFMAYLAIPYEPSRVDALLSTAFDLAMVLRASSGFITAEPTYELAHRAAIGYSMPKARPGLSEHRMRERRVRDYKVAAIDTRLSGIEWGTFLGPGHAGQVDVGALRNSDVFERVVEVSPSLMFLQLTANPADDLTFELEPRLQRARVLLRELLLDTDDLPRPPDAP